MISINQGLAASQSVAELYRKHLKRPIDYHGISYALQVAQETMSLEQVEEVLKWGELPPHKIIADGWDSSNLDGVWPMIAIMHDSLRQRAIEDAKKKHRNTMLILAEHPHGHLNGKGYEMDLSRITKAIEVCISAGLNYHVIGTSWDASQEYGNPDARLLNLSKNIPPCHFWPSIEWDEVHDPEHRAFLGLKFTADNHKVWVHYTPYESYLHGDWAYGLMYQVEKNLTGLYYAKGQWNRPVVLAEMKQSVPASQRWQVFQEVIQKDIHGMCHCGYF